MNVIEFEADFAPFQGESLSGADSFPIYQFSHKKDDFAGNTPMSGAIYMNTEKDKKQGHSIDTFLEQVRNLPQGKYKVENGQIIPY